MPRLVAFLLTLVAVLCISSPSYANTGTTGETTWVNNITDPVTTNQFSSDSALGCPTTIAIWQSDTPAFDGPTYFHVNAIDPTADPFVHASGPYVADASSSRPVKIATIDVASLMQSAQDTGQPIDPNGQGYHYRLAFDFFMTSTVDFWVNCADTTPPVPTPVPQPTPVPTPAPQPSPVPAPVTVPTSSSTTTTTTGSDTTTTGTPNTCPRLKPHQINKLIKADYTKKVKKGRVRIKVKVAKSVGVSHITVQVVNGKHKWSYKTKKRSFTLKPSVRNKHVFGKRSWKRAYVKVTFYRACGDHFVWNLR